MTAQEIDLLIKKFNDYTVSTLFNKHSWNSPASLIKKITKPFDRDAVAKKVSRKTGQLVEDLIKEWELEGSKAIEKGKIIHDSIEKGFVRSMKCEYTTPEIADKLVEFARNYVTDLKARCIAREKLITSEESKLFGYLDYLVWSESLNKLILVDWKTNKEIDRFNKWENFLYPLSNIDASKANIYSFQLSCYKWMLLKQLGIEVDEMHIVWLNEKNKNYEIIKAVDMTKSIELVLGNTNQPTQMELPF